MQRGPLFDWWLFILALLLSVSGLLYIYTATWVAKEPPGPEFSRKFLLQCSYLVAALVVFYVLRRINWGLKPDSWVWFYIPVIVVLILVQVIGHASGSGSTRWIDLGPVNVQPSEFAKLGLTMILAWLYSIDSTKVRQSYWVGLWVMLSMLALVVIQPDLGTSLVFVAVFFIMSMFAAVPRRWIFGTIAVMVLGGLFVWFFRIPVGTDAAGNPCRYRLPPLTPQAEDDGCEYIEFLRDYQRGRITAFINPGADPQGTGYHVTQSQIAIGGGGISGQGFLRGTQTHGGFIPVVYSDFIFAVIGEEFGFIGCAWVLLLYFLLIARILALSRDAITLYERYICYGISAIILFHVFINIGMTIRLAPITGLPLPFISYGGSALMTMWLCMAILQSIFANSKRDYRFGKPQL